MSQTDKRTDYGVKRAVWLRNYQRARGRALARLAQENPERYRELLEEERERDEAEGKSWLDITGRTKRSMGSASAPNGNSSVPESHQDRVITEEGNLG